jgi:hypothetical protein
MEDIYDVSNYTDAELYEIIGFPHEYSQPTQLELEAKIIAMIKQNMKVRGVTGRQMTLFFQNVYTHFFKDEEEPTNEAPPPVQKTQTVSYTTGTLNPILKETYVRTISIDSQYRDMEYPSSTDFTMNFTETLKDVVSMKLYAVQIPYTWYTISRKYGSNYFYFKPNTEIEENGGIMGHDYQVRIDPGNYTALTLVETINTSMSQLGSVYTDVSFGNTRLTYNESNCKSTITVDIQKVYNESCYEMKLSTELNAKLSMNETTRLYTVYSNKYSTTNNISVNIDASNNYFDIIHFYSWGNETPIQTIRVFLKSATTATNLPDGIYNASDLLNDISYTLANNQYLLNTSTIEEIKTDGQFQICLSVQLNRFATTNQIHSKIKVRFPTEIEWINQNKQVWTSASSGTSSIFQFPSAELYFSQVYSNQVVFPFTPESDQTIRFNPVSEGISNHPSNLIEITIKQDTYSTEIMLLETINAQLEANEYTKGSELTFDSIQGIFLFKININKVYTTKDYKIVFFDTGSFTRCSSGSSYRNATIDNTLGWIMGYRTLVEYAFLQNNQMTGDLATEFKNPDTLLSTGSEYTFLSQSLIKKDVVTLKGDTVLSIYLYNYFMIILDDYNQNHLNDGLVTIARRDSSVTLPNYANRSKYQCDPVTGNLIHTTTDNSLTQRQMYSVQQIINTQNTNRGSVTSGPFIKDMFAVLPLKTNSEPGTVYVEFGGTLQVQERIYFGPVNIHRISIKLINDKGDVVDLNGANWSIQLTCQQLYQRTTSS